MVGKKIDNNGNYLEFQGVTVIAPVGTHNQDLWQAIHKFLRESPVLSKYFSPLPLQSYHVTTCNLYTQNDGGDNWNSFISEKLGFFKQLNKQLSKTEFSPEIAINSTHGSGAIQLFVSLPQCQAETIRLTAEKLGLKDKVPSIFHITLAYEYKEYNYGRTYPAIQSELAKLLAICQQYTKKLILDVPRLCFFHSMKEFTPWNGVRNPFIVPQEPVKNSGFFRSSKQIGKREEQFGSLQCTLL